MSYCDNLIKQGISPDCANPIVRGIEPNGVIMNRADIDLDATGKVQNGNLSTLVLKAGKTGYKIHVPTNQPYSGTITTMETGTHRNSFTHNVGFIILDHAPDVVVNVIEPLANGEFVIVYENKFKGDDGKSAFQVVGLDQGLKASTLENDKWSEDTEGGWNVVMTETKSPRASVFLYDTDYATTKTAIDALIQP